jgi:Fe(3+) dicitrate transport protein
LAAGGGTGSGNLFNGGAAMVTGVEVDFFYGPKISKNIILPLQLSYTYTDAYFTNSFESEFDAWGSVNEGDKLPYIAPHQLVLNAGLEHTRFNFNLSTKYTDKMRTVAGQRSMSFNERTDSSFIIDASFQYNFSWKVSVFSSVYNLTNANYIVSRRPAGVRPGLPRTITFGIKANF